MKRKLIIATVVTGALVATGSASAVALAGTGSGGAAGADGRPAAQKSSVSSVHLRDNEDAREAKAAKLTAPEAAAKAKKAVPGTVSGIDLDNDRQGLVWEVDVLKGGDQHDKHELKLDAGNGKVLTNHKDKDDDDDDDAVPAHLKVSASDAAEKAAGHGKVTSVDFEGKDDDDHAKGHRPTWEVETTDKQGKEHDLTVDPHSGKVVQRSVGYDD